MTVIHALRNRHAISDVYLLGRCATKIGSWLLNCETVQGRHNAETSFLEFFFLANFPAKVVVRRLAAVGW